ncbi:redoxin domain-containing protein [Dyadobacter sp. CY326]|uniref:redoxin domain-containing protein n=1 Tax=Dyadobacter sp. CY326 TaxID=2907300 RepID=UPI001F3D775F|nr:redoxin domain-containing protein [Dyadobacter sp. CY326]MCE7066621.1 redoxin domain-containing protein [Dyadobacter sp. CY326]
MYYEFEDEMGNISTLTLRDKEVLDPNPQLKTGDVAPNFHLRKEDGNFKTSLYEDALSIDSTSVTDMVLHKPLVLSFYCHCWGSYAPKHLEMLAETAQKVEAFGGQLLVLTNESPQEIERIVRRNKTDFPFYHDTNYQVARSYGVYSDTHPIWERVAGISEDVFTPALFVISKSRRITYSFIDENFDSRPQIKDVLKAVYHWKD